MHNLRTILTQLQNTQQLEDDKTLSAQCVLTLQIKVDAFIANPTLAPDIYQLILSSVDAESTLSAWQDTIVRAGEIPALLGINPQSAIWTLGAVDVVWCDESGAQPHTPVQQGKASMSLLDHTQRLNVALTRLIASTTRIETLVQSNLPVGMQSYANFFELAATCSGQIAAMQEEIVRVWTDQAPDTEKREALPHN